MRHVVPLIIRRRSADSPFNCCSFYNSKRHSGYTTFSSYPIIHPLLPSPQSDRSDKLQLTATGSGGLDELREHLDESKASFGYARIQYANDKESKREKFILITWIGSSCKVMRKAKVCIRCSLVQFASLSTDHSTDLGACRRHQDGLTSLLH